MSSNRLSYDECAHAQKTGERVNPLTYQLYPQKHSQCQWCGDKHESTKSELSFMERVTMENDLLNIERKSTRCDNNKYQPPSTPVDATRGVLTPARLCERDVVWTNLMKPTSNGLPELKEESSVCA